MSPLELDRELEIVALDGSCLVVGFVVVRFRRATRLFVGEESAWDDFIKGTEIRERR